MKKKVHFTFKGEWMRKEDWLDENIEWNDTMVIIIKPLPPKERPFDWLYAYTKIPAGMSKKFLKQQVLECLKAMEDAEKKGNNLRGFREERWKI